MTTQIKAMKEARPSINYDIACYHDEKVKKAAKGGKRTGKGNSTKRVYTHRANIPFKYTMWADATPPEYAFDFIKTIKIVRLS